MATQTLSGRRTRAPRQIVLPFDGGAAKTRTKEMRGGKGANLARMVDLGLPIPPGFTVSTTFGRTLTQLGQAPKRFTPQLEHELKRLEEATDKVFGDPDNPLLVSVRSGAQISMPGMMDTILNVGLNRTTVRGLAATCGDRFAWDCYRRFLAQYAQVVCGVSPEVFDEIVDGVKQSSGIVEDSELTVRLLRRICWRQRQAVERLVGRPIPEDPTEQLLHAIGMVAESWDSNRAQAYREAHNLPSWHATAINVQAMVFGNLGETSGTGVVFSHDVRTGQPGLYGEFLPNAQGEDVVAGTRTPRPVAEMAQWAPEAYQQLEAHVAVLAEKFDDVVDVEFTVEDGQLYLLQVRRAMRSPLASVTLVVHREWAGKCSREEAVKSVSLKDVDSIRRQTFEPEALMLAVREHLLAKGNPASPGAASGVVVRSSAQACQRAAQGDSVILVRSDTSPDDLDGMLVSSAIVTATGGATSHAAVVARDLGLPAVVGVSLEALDMLTAGHVVSVDGNGGVVVRGEVALQSHDLPKEANIFLRWVKRFGYQPRIDFSMAETHWNVNRMLNDVYLADAMAHAANGSALEVESSELRDSVVDQTATCFVTYLALATAAELRHTGQYSRQWPFWVVTRLQSEFGLLVSGQNAGDLTRQEAQASVRNALVSTERSAHVQYFQLALEVFSAASWNMSFGGRAWAVIAQAGLRFLAGEIPPKTFVDHVFDLRHNGGGLFDKHVMVSEQTNEWQIARQLDGKKLASTISALYQSLSYYGYSENVAAMWRRGVRAGLWQ